MSTRIKFIALFASLIWLAGCGAMRQASGSSQETDDVYYSSSDAELEAQRKADAQAKAVKEIERTEQPGHVVNEERYEEARESKYGHDEEHRYDEDFDPYADDDFYYSRRLRRFSTRAWGYYDPYFAYDPYFVMGTSTWGYYANDPWFYDPFFYNGPSFSWTYGWGYPSWYYLPYQSFWYNPWNQPFGYGGWGWGPSFYGGGWYPGWYGGYGGYGYYGYNPYCPPGLFYGNGGGGWWGAGNPDAGATGIVGPRPSMSSLNANNRPGNTPEMAGTPSRPYQDPNEVSVRPVVTDLPPKTKPTQVSGRPVDAVPVKPVPSVKPDPISQPPVRPEPKPVQQGIDRPKQNVQERPVQTEPVTPKPKPQQERPKENTVRPNNNSGGYDRPKQDNFNRPSSNPAPSYNRPSGNFSNPSPSPSYSRPSGGSNSMPSGGGGKAVKR